MLISGLSFSPADGDAILPSTVVQEKNKSPKLVPEKIVRRIITTKYSDKFSCPEF